MFVLICQSTTFPPTKCSSRGKPTQADPLKNRSSLRFMKVPLTAIWLSLNRRRAGEKQYKFTSETIYIILLVVHTQKDIRLVCFRCILCWKRRKTQKSPLPNWIIRFSCRALWHGMQKLPDNWFSQHLPGCITKRLSVTSLIWLL